MCRFLFLAQIILFHFAHLCDMRLLAVASWMSMEFNAIESSVVPYDLPVMMSEEAALNNQTNNEQRTTRNADHPY